MKIIKIDDTLIDLTVDNTFITVDSTNYTADMTQYTSEYANIKLVPRVLPNEGDILTVRLRNELTNDIIEPENYFNYLDNYFNLYIKVGNLNINSKYEIEVFKDSVCIYKGKGFSTSKNKQEIQDFTVVKKINNKLRY